jgi:hypothetical protein
MNRRIALISAAVGTFVGVIVAWCGRQLLQLHDPGLSDHQRRP